MRGVRNTRPGSCRWAGPRRPQLAADPGGIICRRMLLFNTAVSAQTSGTNFMNVLNAIHRHYYASLDPKEFMSVKKQLIDDLRTSRETGESRDLERLAEIYQRDLDVGARLATGRSDRR